MFHYNQNQNAQPFQTPSIGAAKRAQNQNIDRFHVSKNIHNQNENYHSFSSMKALNTQQINKRSQQKRRRFGTNLTNKRPITRLNHNNNNNNQYEQQSKTVQIYKPSKQIQFASKENNLDFNKYNPSKSSFRFNIGIKNKSQINHDLENKEEIEYCPKGTSWKPSINKSFKRIFEKAFNIIGQYKLFIPSDKTIEIDYEIQENFDIIHEFRLSNDYLYDTESDTDCDNDDNIMINDQCGLYDQGKPFSYQLPQNCHIPLVEFFLFFVVRKIITSVCWI